MGGGDVQLSMLSRSKLLSTMSKSTEGGFTKTMRWCRGLAIDAKEGRSASRTVNRLSSIFLLKRLICSMNHEADQNESADIVHDETSQDVQNCVKEWEASCNMYLFA